MERTLASETIGKIGKKIKFQGWVDTIRDHGKITFVDLRDRSGRVQCVTKSLPKVTLESVVEIVGTVEKRPEKMSRPFDLLKTSLIGKTVIQIIKNSSKIRFG